MIGPNGAGKTTFFNCISGVYKPKEGHVIFDGKEIEALGVGSFGPIDPDLTSPTYGYITTTPKPG